MYTIRTQKGDVMPSFNTFIIFYKRVIVEGKAARSREVSEMSYRSVLSQVKVLSPDCPSVLSGDWGAQQSESTLLKWTVHGTQLPTKGMWTFAYGRV